MSEVERIVRAVLLHGGKIQAVFGGLPWELVGVEKGEPRLESHGQTLEMSMDANTLEGRPPKKGDTFEVGFGGDVVHGVYTNNEGSYKTVK